MPDKVTEYVAELEEPRVHCCVFVPFEDKLTETEGQLTTSPDVGFMVEVTEIVPTKSNVLFRVSAIVVPTAPELKFTIGLAMILNSPTWTVPDNTWEAAPTSADPV